MQKVIYALGVVTFFGFGGDIAPVLEEPFLGVAAGIRRSFGGNGALWMSFSGFLCVCDVRGTAGFRVCSNVAGLCGYAAFRGLERC